MKHAANVPASCNDLVCSRTLEALIAHPTKTSKQNGGPILNASYLPNQVQVRNISTWWKGSLLPAGKHVSTTSTWKNRFVHLAKPLKTPFFVKGSSHLSWFQSFSPWIWRGPRIVGSELESNCKGNNTRTWMNTSHLKSRGLKMIFSSKWHLFRCYISFRDWQVRKVTSKWEIGGQFPWRMIGKLATGSGFEYWPDDQCKPILSCCCMWTGYKRCLKRWPGQNIQSALIHI